MIPLFPYPILDPYIYATQVRLQAERTCDPAWYAFAADEFARLGLEAAARQMSKRAAYYALKAAFDCPIFYRDDEQV